MVASFPKTETLHGVPVTWYEAIGEFSEDSIDQAMVEIASHVSKLYAKFFTLTDEERDELRKEKDPSSQLN
jgi:hypothetical protein